MSGSGLTGSLYVGSVPLMAYQRALTITPVGLSAYPANPHASRIQVAPERTGRPRGGSPAQAGLERIQLGLPTVQGKLAALAATMAAIDPAGGRCARRKPT